MAAAIRAVFFDLGDTLVERKPEVDEDSIRLIYGAVGLETPSDRELPKLRRRLKAAERATWNSYASGTLLKLGSLDEELAFLRDSFYPAVLSRFGFATLPRDILDELAHSQLGPETFRPFPDVEETFVWLTSLGLKIGCISNALPSAEGILKYLDLWQRFDCRMLSYSADCRCLKPSKRIHAKALGRLQLSGKEAIFVDDRPGFVSAADSIYRLAILLDRERVHLNEKEPRIEQLSDLRLLLNRERLRAGPNEIPFGQLSLFSRAFVQEVTNRVFLVARYFLRRHRAPLVTQSMTQFSC